MKKILLLTISILFCTFAHSFEYTDSIRTFKVDIPDNFEVQYTYQNDEDNLRVIYENGEKETLAILYYYVGGTIDKPKAKEAPMSAVFNEDGLDLVSQNIGRKYSDANLYHNKGTASYTRVYRIVNTDGIVLLIATSQNKDFQHFDTISETYRNYVSMDKVLTILSYIIIIFAGAVLGYSVYAYYRNVAKLITYGGASILTILLFLIFAPVSINSILIFYIFTSIISYVSFRFNIIFF